MAKEAAFLVSHGGSPAAIERASFVPCVTFLSHNIVEEVKKQTQAFVADAPTSLSSFSPSLSTATKSSAGTALKLSRIPFARLLSALGQATGEGTEADFGASVVVAAAAADADAASLALSSFFLLSTSSCRCVGAAPTTAAL